MRLLLLFSCLLFSVSANAQPEKIEATKKLLEASTSPKEQVNLLCLLSDLYYVTSASAAMEYGQKALQVAQQHNDKIGTANAYNRIAAAFNLSGNLDKSVQFYYTSLQISEAVNDSAGMASSYNDLANVIGKKEGYDAAILLYEKSLHIAEALQDTAAIAVALYNLGFSYAGQEKYEKSLAYTKKAVYLRELIGHKHQYAAGLNSIGATYCMQGNWEKAITYHTRALKYAAEATNELEKSYSLVGLAEAYFISKNYNKALFYAQESLKASTKINAMQEMQSTAEFLSYIYIELGNYKQAHAYLTLQEQYKDSISSVKIDARIREMQLAYRNEKADQENQLLKTERTIKNHQLQREHLIQLFIGALLLITSIIAYGFFRGKQRLHNANNLLLEHSSILNNQKEELTGQAVLLQTQKLELERLHTVKDRLFSVIAHDLKGPLTSLQGLLKLAASGAVPDDKFKQFMSTLETSQQGALWLLDNLLVWAKSQMQGFSFHKSEVNLHDLAHENITLLAPQARQKDVILVNNVAPDTVALADAETIKLVLRNLISNAIKFCTAGQQVVLAAELKYDHVLISVTDNGTGIAPENISKLFSDNSFSIHGTAREKGSGLGLSLCKEFVEKNGGAIGVKSESGIGSTFYFTLPLVYAETLQLEEASLEMAIS